MDANVADDGVAAGQPVRAAVTLSPPRPLRTNPVGMAEVDRMTKLLEIAELEELTEILEKEGLLTVTRLLRVHPGLRAPTSSLNYKEGRQILRARLERGQESVDADILVEGRACGMPLDQCVDELLRFCLKNEHEAKVSIPAEARDEDASKPGERRSLSETRAQAELDAEQNDELRRCVIAQTRGELAHHLVPCAADVVVANTAMSRSPPVCAKFRDLALEKHRESKAVTDRSRHSKSKTFEHELKGRTNGLRKLKEWVVVHAFAGAEAAGEQYTLSDIDDNSGVVADLDDEDEGPSVQASIPLKAKWVTVMARLEEAHHRVTKRGLSSRGTRDYVRRVVESVRDEMTLRSVTFTAALVTAFNQRLEANMERASNDDSDSEGDSNDSDATSEEEVEEYDSDSGTPKRKKRKGKAESKKPKKKSKGSSSNKELCPFWAQKQLKHDKRGCDKGKPKCDKRHSFLSGGPD